MNMVEAILSGGYMTSTDLGLMFAVLGVVCAGIIVYAILSQL